MFLTERLFGVMVWIWLFFVFSVVVVIGVLLYIFKEWIRKTYYKIRYPERLIKVIIHYPNNFFNIYWRLVPKDRFIWIDKMQYIYDLSVIRKHDDIFFNYDINKKKNDVLVIKDYNIILEKKGKQTLKINESEEYNFNTLCLIKNRWEKYAEIHYIYNSPFPLNYNEVSKKLEFTSQNLTEIQQNDLFSKLLTLKSEKQIMLILIILIVFNILCTAFLVGKQMGWF